MSALITVAAVCALIVNDWTIIAFFRGVYSRDKPDFPVCQSLKGRRETAEKANGEAAWRNAWEKGE